MHFEVLCFLLLKRIFELAQNQVRQEVIKKLVTDIEKYIKKTGLTI